MSHNPDAVFSSYTGEEYDRLQPLRIDMYRFYHEMAFEFLPFEANEPFRMLDLGPGTTSSSAASDGNDGTRKY